MNTHSSEDTKRKLSASHKGLLSGEKHPMFGKHCSEETKMKISIANKGLLVGDKHPRYNPNRKLVELNIKLKIIMKSLLRRTLCNKTTNTHIMLGYTKEQLKERLASQFKPGMAWENYGKEWHIDHIKPISVFVREGVTDPKIISALDNLQPLWTKDNLKKGAKWTPPNE